MNSKSVKRCIMIFPHFDNMNIIDEIRDKYDPLSKKVRPHITLVFPFESSISKEELEEYLSKVLKETRSFKLTLEGIIKVDNSTGLYLFLKIQEGIKEIKAIHNRLYEGMLSQYKPNWLNQVEFMPHMTIGCFTDRDELWNAYNAIATIKERFSTLIEKVSVEIIDENEDSNIEVEMNLRK